MTTKRWLLALAGTAALSAAGTIVARIALEEKTRRLTRDMNPMAGAIVATLQSAALSETREYFVHLPEAYASDTTAHYPVLYVLDGEWQSDHTAATAALLARIGVVPRMIVVGVPGVDGKTRHRDYTPPEMRLASDGPSSAMGEADRFLSFLRNELIGRIERDYRTTRPRMLAGVSQGGLFVVYSEIADPALFDGRFAHSPALWPENEAMVDRLETALRKDSLPPGFLYLSLGADESEQMMAAFTHAVRILERDAPVGLVWRSDLSVGGRHRTNAVLSTPVGLCKMFTRDIPDACRAR
jgi:predicted alpha/beta superfamily hydrolase